MTGSIAKQPRASLLKIILSLLRKHQGKFAFALASYCFGKLWEYKRFAKHVKYVKGMPVVGLLPAVVSGLFNYRLHDDIVAWHATHGRTCAANLGGVCIVFTYDPVNLEHILKDNFDNYIKGSVFTDPFSELLGDGIFNVDGEKWYHQRKTASRMFTKKIFETHIWHVIGKNISRIEDVLLRSSGEEVCLFNLMNRFTLDTIGEIGFSKSIGSIEDPSSPFLKSFDYVQGALAKRAYTSQSFPTFKLLRALGLFWEKELPAHLKMLNDYCDLLVGELLDKVAVGDDSSFVGLFAKDAEGQDFKRRDEVGFRTYLRDMVLNFLIAGRDTTAQSLTWTFFELAQHPDVVAKIRKEVFDVCGNNVVRYEDVNRLQYVRAVVDEGLRLHPSVPLDVKLAVNDDVLPDGSVIPAGSRLFYVPYSQARDQELWGKDAADFRPERWMEMDRRPSTYEFVAFNAGKRECLGKRLAEMEMVTMVASVVRRFDVCPTIAAKDVRYDIQLTLGCSSGLPVKVKPLVQ